MFIKLIQDNIEKLNNTVLSRQKKAVAFLEANPDKINWHYLPVNPVIFDTCDPYYLK
jgi:hypothetical protein